jgi:hypothetical protein
MLSGKRGFHMRKGLVAILCVASLSLAAGCQQKSAQQDAVQKPDERLTPTVNPADAAFGYTDTTGSKLLMLTDDNQVMEATKAKSMDTAVCSDGREFPIRYLQFQNYGAANNGRQSAGNLSNDRGHLFEIVRERAVAGDTCLLVTSNYLRDFPIVRSDFSKAEREKRSNDPSRSKSIEKEKGRTVKTYWLLHSSAATQEVAAVEFNALGDSLLGSLVLVEPGQLSFFDMPASLKEGRERGGCWRVDDDCRFDFEEMDVPAVLGKPGAQLVFFTTGGPEGQLIKLFQAKGGKLVELLGAYRYHSPV